MAQMMAQEPTPQKIQAEDQIRQEPDPRRMVSARPPAGPRRAELAQQRMNPGQVARMERAQTGRTRRQATVRQMAHPQGPTRATPCQRQPQEDQVQIPEPIHAQNHQAKQLRVQRLWRFLIKGNNDDLEPNLYQKQDLPVLHDLRFHL